jgi:NitT/TauT family transport system substrate-binding protein
MFQENPVMRRIALSCVLVFALTGCSVLGGSDESTQSAPSGGLEQTKVTVGTLPIVDAVTIAIAQEKGYFKQEGLEVEQKVLAGGAAAVPGLVNGELQFAFGNFVSYFNAQAKGVADLKLVADGYQATQGMFLIMKSKDSPIGKPQDLTGKKIAVNTKNNIVELTARSALEANGVDPRTVQFVEFPFPDMQSALERKQVDAAFMVEPFITQSQRAAGMTPVVDAATGATQDVPIAGWAASKKFAESAPRTVAAFQRAIVRAQQDAADRRNVEEAIPAYAKVDKDTASLMHLGTWPTTLNEVRLQRVVDLMHKYGVLDKELNVDAMIFREQS